MDRNNVDISVCYPNTFVRFAGQIFLEAKDRDLALLCLRAYNDWICDFSEETSGRVIGVGLVPLWDPSLAAEEVLRLADKGTNVVAFTELPASLGLPSIHTRHWDPLFRTCDEIGTVIGIHIGSSSKFVNTSPDAPPGCTAALQYVNPAMALTDWIFSGTLERFPKLKLTFAECEVGWLPYALQRMDHVWETHFAWGWGAGRSGKDVLSMKPSEYFRRQVLCAFADDAHGVRSIEEIGVDSIAFETDYPHGDGTWPNSYAKAMSLTESLSSELREKVLRTNALDFFGIKPVQGS